MTISEIQEWVTYHGFPTRVDGKLGPATRKCVEMFQAANGLPVSGTVDATTEKLLVKPLVEASTFHPRDNDDGTYALVRSTVVEIARLQLHYKAREIGGENRGPWVRLYMNGRQGREWPWCAGFATWCLQRACQIHSAEMPVPYAFGCDYLAGVAQRRGLFTKDRNKILPGHFFLVRKAPNNWQHIGIIEHVDLADGVLTTIEGNTNDDGVPEGYEVCRRYRSVKDRDFIVY
jgi:peptidoglycan hydrolase-like protein with peptidoglycan-binding domain